VKAIAVAILILASVFAVHFALGASGADRPAGLDERNWISVNDRLGFVVTTPHLQPGPGGDAQVLLLTPPTEGYFMIRASTGWQRISIKDPLKGPGSSG
jgi:hypothetical protein